MRSFLPPAKQLIAALLLYTLPWCAMAQCTAPADGPASDEWRHGIRAEPVPITLHRTLGERFTEMADVTDGMDLGIQAGGGRGQGPDSGGAPSPAG